MEHTEAEIDSVIARQNVAKEGWTTYYVDKADGNDGNNGLRWETAFKTIQHAIDTGESWAKIYVAAGTYVENVTVNTSDVILIGEDRDTVIIRPTAGVALSISARCIVLDIQVYSPTAGVYGVDIQIGAHRAELDNIVCDGVAGAYGIISRVLFADIHNCYMSNANLVRGIEVSGGLSMIHNNFMLLSNVAAVGILLDEVAVVFHDNQVFENDIWSCGAIGISATGNTWRDLIIHNNLYNNTVQINDAGGSNNKFSENYFNDYTTDTNNDGLCDGWYAGGGIAVDYAPVSKANGWKQVSLGISASNYVTIDNIFDLVNAILTLTETGGTITTDGTVQNVYINETPAGIFSPKMVQIDFTDQTAAETVVIRESYRIKSVGAGGAYIEKDAVTFAGVQSPKLKNIILEPNRFGVKVTLERTAGGIKTYDWEAIYKI